MSLAQLAVPFLVIAGVVNVFGLVRIPKPRRKLALKQLGITVVAIMVLTIVFDNLMIGSALFDYDHAALLGWYIGKAPVEDLFYAAAGLLTVTGMWNLVHNE